MNLLKNKSYYFMKRACLDWGWQLGLDKGPIIYIVLKLIKTISISGTFMIKTLCNSPPRKSSQRR